jgi:D-alanyl-D-alanine carboxypeptidase/D-alanyl-D-alanine-endopeptidase (penicillin-binding protein 4)
VRALAGFLLDRSGKRWIVVCLINDPKARLGKPAIDALLLWVAKALSGDARPAAPDTS